MKYKIKYAILVTFVFLQVSAVCQNRQYEIIDSSFNFSQFPEISFALWARANDQLEAVSLIESNTHVQDYSLTYEASYPQKVPENKVLFILIENHYQRKGIKERKFFKKVLANGLKGRIKSGDKVYIATFDWYRNNKYVFVQNRQPLSSYEQTIAVVNNIESPSNLNNQQTGSDINSALSESLKLLNTKYNVPGLSANILVLSDDYPNVAHGAKTADEVKNESIQLNIPIYALSYDINTSRYNNIMEYEICNPTHGEYYLSEGNDPSKAATALADMIRNMNANTAGQTYRVSFVSNEKRVGKKNKVEVRIGEQHQVTTIIDYPFNLFDWVKNKPILTIALVALLLLIITLIIYSVRGANRKRLERLIYEQEVELQATNAEKQIEDLKQKQIEKDEYLKYKQIEKDEKQELERLASLMRAKGLTPRLIYEFNGRKGEFYINSPKFLIGRDDKQNDFFMKIPSISRIHAEIRFHESGVFIITDLQSTNGVFVNGEKVSSVKLANGDSILIGDVKLKLNL